MAHYVLKMESNRALVFNYYLKTSDDDFIQMSLIDLAIWHFICVIRHILLWRCEAKWYKIKWIFNDNAFDRVLSDGELVISMKYNVESYHLCDKFCQWESFIYVSIGPKKFQKITTFQHTTKFFRQFPTKKIQFYSEAMSSMCDGWRKWYDNHWMP